MARTSQYFYIISPSFFSYFISFLHFVYLIIIVIDVINIGYFFKKNLASYFSPYQHCFPLPFFLFFLFYQQRLPPFFYFLDVNIILIQISFPLFLLLFRSFVFNTFFGHFLPSHFKIRIYFFFCIFHLFTYD